MVAKPRTRLKKCMREHNADLMDLSRFVAEETGAPVKEAFKNFKDVERLTGRRIRL